ncbi:hypothetical protein [Candidatus Palauibacter sp.]|uniref:hypothetical protein n=1 Tax=Candidatus Palauibacter sp. TaxID=3101350 RepID=UPI003AF3080D
MTIAFMVVLGMIVLIPVLAIVIDSPLSEALARRIGNGGDAPQGQSARLDAIEQELQYLSQTVESMREEAAFVRALVEGDDTLPALPTRELDRRAGDHGER